MDANNVASGSPEQSDSLELELPASLAEALIFVASVQQQTNNLMLRLIEQNQQIMAAVIDIDQPEDMEPREDMEGRPIRNS